MKGFLNSSMVLPIFVGVWVFIVFWLGYFLAGSKPPEIEYITEYVTEYRYIYTEEQQPEIEYTSLGVFEVTAYCCENYPHICNNGDATTTATGTTPTAGRTIAVDPSIIPLNTEVIINGHTYIAEDTGGNIKGNRIDIVFETHEEALNFGRRTLEIFVSERNNFV